MIRGTLIQPLPKRTEVYERLAAGLTPAFAAVEMRRVPRLSWPCWAGSSQSPETTLYVWLQVDEKATDIYAGGGFRVEFEKSASNRPAAGLAGRALFFQLLTPTELTRLLEQQNRVIRALQLRPVVWCKSEGPSGLPAR